MTRYYYSSKNLHRQHSVNIRKLSFVPVILISLLVLFMTSCEEGSTQIGSSLLPGGDFVDIKSTDTIRAWSYTKYDDAVRTENPSLSYLGTMYDPYFGTTKAEFVTEIRMAGEWDDKYFVVDSVKLFLTLLDVKGVSSDEIHTIRISEIAERLYTDSVYYSNKEVPVTGFVLADIPLPTLKPDTVNIIEIDLPLSLGNYLTRDTSKLFYSNTRPDFRSWFNGLYFQMDPGIDPLLVTLSLAPPKSLGNYNNILVLYMHDEVDEPKQFYFVLDAMNQNASFNKISRNFTTAEPGKMIEHINDDVKDSLTYLQYLNGVYTSLSLPGLANLKNDPEFDNIAVNKARLTVPVYSDGNLYQATTAPYQLYLRYKTSDGSKFIVPDYNIGTYQSFFDGKIDTLTSTYTFNIVSFLQGYLDDDTGVVLPELELFQFSGTRNVILKANNSKNPVKFEFTYTKF